MAFSNGLFEANVASCCQKCLKPRPSRREMCTLSVSDVNYHKFSQGVAFHAHKGKNVNVMLE